MTQTYDRRRMLTGTPWKEVLIFSGPIMIGYLLQILYGTADMIILGHEIGSDSLAAIGSATTLMTLFTCLSWGLSAGSNAVMARYNGADDVGKLRDSAMTSLLVSMMVGGIVTILSIVLCEPVLRYVMGVPEEIMGMACQYCWVYALGFVALFGYNAVASMLRSVGDSRSVLYVLAATSCMNIVLDVLFIMVLDLGVIGAATTTTICQVVSLIASYIIMTRKIELFSFVRGDVRIHREHLRAIMDAGMTMAIQQAVIYGSMVILQQAVNSYGADMMASFAVERRLETFFRLPISAIASGTVTFAGMHYGAGMIDRMSKGIGQLLAASLVMTVAISLTCIALAGPMVSVFNLSGTPYDYCVEHTRVALLLFPMFALYFPLLSVFQGMGRPRLSAAIVILELVIRIICIYTLGGDGPFGYTIIWWNMLFGWAIAMVTTFILYGRMINKARSGMKEATS